MIYHPFSWLAALCFLVALAACSNGSDTASGPNENISPEVADRVLTGAKVYTLNADQPWADTLAVKDGALIFVGDSASAEKNIGPDTQVVDLGGRLVLPGFIDTHAHPMQSAGFFYSLQLSPGMSLAEIQAAVAAYADANPNRPIVLGFGYGEYQFDSEGPTKGMLDTAVSDRPVLLIDEGGHSGWANSAALELFGIGKNTPDPIPGKHYYRRDKEGNPTGSMIESQTFFPPLAAFNAYDVDAALDHKNIVYRLFQISGVTTVFDAGMSSFEGTAMEVAAQLDQEGRLPFRLVTSHMIQNPNQLPNAVEHFQNMQATYAGNRLKVGAIKIHNDGTIEARSAAMLEPYADQPDVRGQVLLEADVLSAFVLEADTAGIDLHIHAIGDRTVREALDAVQAARKANPTATTRHTMTHLEQIDDTDIPRFSETRDLIAQTTPLWHQVFSGADEILGEERAARYHRYRSMIEGGVRVTFGSDFPSTGSSPLDMAPLRNIEVGHTRRPQGAPDHPALGSPEERLTLEELVRGYTIDAAYQLRLEDKIGSLEVGKEADLIVLNKNLFEVPSHEIHQIVVDVTMLGGEIVHGELP